MGQELLEGYSEMKRRETKALRVQIRGLGSSVGVTPGWNQLCSYTCLHRWRPGRQTQQK